MLDSASINLIVRKVLLKLGAEVLHERDRGHAVFRSEALHLDELYCCLTEVMCTALVAELSTESGNSQTGAMPVPGLERWIDADVAADQRVNRPLLRRARELLRAELTLCSTDGRTTIALEAEAIGAVYEHLLGYSLVFDPENVGGLLLRDGTRRRHNSYFTPGSLVRHLVLSALEPVVNDRLNRVCGLPARERALLEIRICDPACGAGSFLLEATRYLGRKLHAIRGAPHSENTLAGALADVLAACIYGVDKDPVVARLCGQLLWREAGRRESSVRYLRDHVRPGDALVMDWESVFPEIATQGGFDTILVNPPWDMIQPQEVEFFTSCGRPDIATLPGVQRKAAIRHLDSIDPSLALRWAQYRREVETEVRYLRRSGKYPLSTAGKLNASTLFIERALSLIAPGGRLGCIVPSGFVTDAGTSGLLHDLLETGSLLKLYHFDNRAKLFPAVGQAITFCLLTVAPNSGPAVHRETDCAFFLHNLRDLEDSDRHVSLTPERLLLLNPNTRTCPIFRSRQDAERTEAVYRHVPVLVRETPPEENPWGMRFRQGLFNMTGESHLFKTRTDLEQDGWTLQSNVFCRGKDRCLPLYEAKMFHHFDHRWSHAERSLPVPERQNPASVVMPRYWVTEHQVESRLQSRWTREWLLAWRLVCRSTDERTVIGTVVPRTGYGNSSLLLFPATESPVLVASLVACLNSFALDYIARQKVGGTNLNFHILKQLPVLPPDFYVGSAPWSPNEMLATWITRRVLELVYTSRELAPFARDLGYMHDPFPWEPERRSLVRAELDAAFLHLYGFSSSDAEAIMDGFTGVKAKDVGRFGQYRTRDSILTRYHLLERAMNRGLKYRGLSGLPRVTCAG